MGYVIKHGKFRSRDKDGNLVTLRKGDTVDKLTDSQLENFGDMFELEESKKSTKKKTGGKQE